MKWIEAVLAGVSRFGGDLNMHKVCVVSRVVLLMAAAAFAQSRASEPALVFSLVNLIDATGFPMQPDLTVIVLWMTSTSVTIR